MPKKQVKKPENVKESMQKMFGTGISYASDKEERFENISWLDTGSFTLNKIINQKGKGIPASNMVEIFGASTSGKSVTGLHVIRSTQEQDGIAVYFDTEGSFNPPLAKSIGINLERLMIVDPTTTSTKNELNQLTMKDVVSRVEHIVRAVRKQYGDQKLLTFVWDSLGGTCFEEDLDPDSPKLTQGLSERKLKRWITRIRPLISSTNTLLLVVNQVFGRPGQFASDKSAGGKSVKFHSEIRIKCVLEDNKKGKVFDKNGVPIGARLHYSVVKNRVGPPWKTGTADFIFSENGEPKLDYYSGYADYLALREAIEVGKGRLIVGEDTYRSKKENGFIRCEKMEKLLQDHPELLTI